MTRRITEHSYLVPMIDYGNGPARPMGFEAVVDPELTRRGLIDLINKGEIDRDRLAFVHEVRDCTVTDITADILAECDALETV